ncbi:hypothetical protein CLAFUW4_09829 [Fulvia fulva]|uniref:Uncharacterized protein n=1 Tax=Passalora fulva TaxID=5499 RepID=A0A9Q8UU91_PASFU|nr:uncharacterized protein CLAFUR5_12411 [Fulvia fulva]KAK4616397.1 hypothetical protein CLAFUR0_09828 [Fulvia fulva]UJO22542.1 hypothetical protein CLAFUR5_12411 [Fulvia fulva]WPV19296.1 hypothetical protein CLAFUW4_09829 [Fulvia fulva]WPV33834.1 hypothetical protein CLAFUW7_09832 [Fulvia fulva]
MSLNLETEDMGQHTTMDDTPSASAFSNPAWFLPIPDNDMTDAHIPDSSGPLKRSGCDVEAATKRVKRDKQTVELGATPGIRDTRNPEDSELLNSVRGLLDEGLGLSQAEKELLAHDLDMGKFDAKAEQKVAEIAQQQRSALREVRRRESASSRAYRRHLAEKELENAKLKQELAALEPPFSRDQMRRATEAKEAAEKCFVQMQGVIDRLKRQVQEERAARRRDHEEAYREVNRYEARLDALALVVKAVIEARKAFSRFGLAEPLTWRNLVAESQLPQPLHNHGPTFDRHCLACVSGSMQPGHHGNGQTSQQESPEEDVRSVEEPSTVREHRATSMGFPEIESVDTIDSSSYETDSSSSRESMFGAPTVLERPQMVSTGIPKTTSQEPTRRSPGTEPKPPTVQKRKILLRTLDDYIKTDARLIQPLSTAKLGRIASRSGFREKFRLGRVIKFMRDNKRIALSQDELKELYGQCTREERLHLTHTSGAGSSAASSSAAEESEKDGGEAEVLKESFDPPCHDESGRSTENQHGSTSTVTQERDNTLMGCTGSAPRPTDPVTAPLFGAFGSARQASSFGKPSAPLSASTETNKASTPSDKAADDIQEDKGDEPAFTPPTQPRAMRGTQQGSQHVGKGKGKGPADPTYHEKIEETNRTHRVPLAHRDPNIGKGPAAASSKHRGLDIKGAAAAEAAPEAESDPYAAERERNRHKRETRKAAHNKGPQPGRRGDRPNNRRRRLTMEGRWDSRHDELQRSAPHPRPRSTYCGNERHVRDLSARADARAPLALVRTDVHKYRTWGRNNSRVFSGQRKCRGEGRNDRESAG